MNLFIYSIYFTNFLSIYYVLSTSVLDTSDVGMNEADKIRVLNRIYIYKETKWLLLSNYLLSHKVV